MKSRLLLVAVGLVSLLAGAILYHLIQPQPPTPVGADARANIELHSIPLSGVDGAQTTLQDWNSDILLVNFWAPWCAPCRREIPALLEIQQEYAERSVRILGIAFDGAEPVQRFASEYAIDYPLFLAGNRSAMYNAAFGNPSGSLPFTALLGPDRAIAFQHNGEMSAQQLREQLERLLTPK